MQEFLPTRSSLVVIKKASCEVMPDYLNVAGLFYKIYFIVIPVETGIQASKKKLKTGFPPARE